MCTIQGDFFVVGSGTLVGVARKMVLRDHPKFFAKFLTPFSA